MSRGPGRIERALTDALTDDWRTMYDLAEQITDSPSRAMVESVRRACRRMVARGTVELDYRDTGYPTSYGRRPNPLLWSEIGEGRNAYDPDHRPAAPCWTLVARKC